jgi:predicted nucleic acid-binding protein
VILLDTSGLLSALDSSQNPPRAGGGKSCFRPPALVALAVCTGGAGLSRRLARRFRRTVQLAEEVKRGAYVLEPMAAGDVASAHAIIECYADLGISLADASIAVLARRHRVRDVLTLDERHFPRPEWGWQAIPAAARGRLAAPRAADQRGRRRAPNFDLVQWGPAPERTPVAPVEVPAHNDFDG